MVAPIHYYSEDEILPTTLLMFCASLAQEPNSLSDPNPYVVSGQVLLL